MYIKPGNCSKAWVFPLYWICFFREIWNLNLNSRPKNAYVIIYQANYENEVKLNSFSDSNSFSMLTFSIIQQAARIRRQLLEKLLEFRRISFTDSCLVLYNWYKCMICWQLKNVSRKVHRFILRNTTDAVLQIALDVSPPFSVLSLEPPPSAKSSRSHSNGLVTLKPNKNVEV